MPRCLMEPAAKYCRRFFTQFIDLIPRRKLIIAQMLRSVRSFSRRFSPVLALRFLSYWPFCSQASSNNSLLLTIVTD